MPYSVRRGKGIKKWKIINKRTGKVVGSSTTKAKAIASIKYRLSGEKKR